jgi:hypothetical protein
MENISEKHEGNNANTLLGVVASTEKVLICNNCKDIWIAPKDRCDCGCTTLTETHESNRVFTRNYA